MLEKIEVWRPSGLDELELRRGWSVREPYPRHWHEEYQLCLILDGGGELAYRGSSHATPAASIFIIHPGEVHENQTRTGCSFRSLYASTYFIRRIATETAARPQHLPFFPQPLVFDRDLVELYLRLHTSLETSHSRLVQDSRLLEFFVRLITRHAHERLQLKLTSRERLPVQRVREYLTEFYADNVSLDELARIARLSPFHLNRMFCREVGMPPHAFQTQVRIARAKTLLREGWSISRVAAQTGFTDQSHFTRHFKRLMKLTPGRYLQQSKNVQDGSRLAC